MYISILSDYPCLEVVRVRVRTVRRYVVVVDVDAGVDLCDLLPGGWLSARLDSTRRPYVVHSGLTVFTPVCCAALCCVLLLRCCCCVVSYACVRVLTPSRDVLCVWSSLLRALLPYGGVVVVVDDVVGVAS